MKKNLLFSTRFKQILVEMFSINLFNIKSFLFRISFILMILFGNNIQAQKVLVIGSSGSPYSQTSIINTVVSRLTALNVFSNVTGQWVTGSGQVTLSQLNQYDAVMVFTNTAYSSSFGLDAVLRDYVDAGGGVAVFVFANASIPLGSNWPYNVLSPAGQSTGVTNIGTVNIPTHPALNYPYVINTSTWNIGSSFSSTSTTLTSGSYSIFKFSDGRPGLQAKENIGTSGAGRVIDFAIYPNYAANVEADKMIANILTWLMGAINVSTASTCLNNNQFNFTFVDNNSSNPVVSYSWNFGDGSTSTLSNPSKSYSASGTYNIALTITRQDNTQSTFGTSANVDGINVQPATSLNICQNANTGNVLTSQVTGQNISYQWYSNTTNSNTGGTSLGSANGAQTASLTIPTSTIGTNYYYLQSSNSCGTSTSNVSSVIINPASVAGTASASATTVCTGSTVNLLLAGNTGSVQWQSSANNTTWADISGATTTNYTTTAISATTYFRAIVTSGGCASATSNTLTISTNPLPTITLGTVINVANSATSFSIPYTAIANSPTLYSVSAGASALSSFTPIVDASFSGATGNLAVAIPANSTPATYNFNLTVKNATTGCISAVYPITQTIVFPPPTITSFTPTSGAVGSTVTITGTGFNTTAANNVVYFGGAKAAVISSTATQLTVTVPDGSTRGPISVTTGGATALSNKIYNLTNSSIATATFSFADKGIVSNLLAGSSNSDVIVGVGDFDNDGWPDIFKAGNGSVQVNRNLLTSTTATVATTQFSTASAYTVSGSVMTVAVADIDSDGKLDIITGSSTGLSILRNISTSGNISFAAAVNISTATTSIKIADFNYDGKLDIAALHQLLQHFQQHHLMV
jgi:PKD domain/IPT/TIG domain/FG-GAP-like repeat